MTEEELAAQLDVHRSRLRVHCHRMTGSVDEADDLVQETMLRAWRSRAGFEGRSLDALADRAPRVLPQDVVPAVSPADEPRATPPLAPELPWLQPFPDRLLDPEALLASRESIELAFLAALQHVPVRQRAILILRDVLGWSAKEVAAQLELTVAAVTSTLQRAHATMKTLVPTGRTDWAPLAPPSDAERAVLARYMAAWEHDDPGELTRMLRDDVRWAMPPAALWFEGRAMVERRLREFPIARPRRNRSWNSTIIVPTV